MIEINHFVSGNDLLELDDIEFPEFYNCSVEAFMINTEDSKMSKIGPGAMRKIFKYVEGGEERTLFIRITRYLEHINDNTNKTIFNTDDEEVVSRTF